MSKLLILSTILCMVLVSCGEDCVDAEGDKWYQDLDGDGLGNPNISLNACEQPVGYVSDNTDDFDLVISSKQRGVVAYIGATWCPPCGEWGGPLLEYMDDNISEDDLVVLSFHSSDRVSSLNSDGAEYAREIGEISNEKSVPRIFVGGGSVYEFRGIFSSHSSNQNRIDNDLARIQAQDANVGVSASARMEDDKVIVQTGVEFLKSSNEQFHIATYVLEDKIIADQKVGSTSSSSTMPNVEHNDVVIINQQNSSSFKGTSMGSSFSSGQVVSDEFTISVPAMTNNTTPVNMNNLKVAVVVWRGSALNMENGVVVQVN